MKTKHRNAIQDHYADDFAWCYGCGRLNENGHHLRTSWLDDNQTITIFTPKPEHMAVQGFVYGGVLASLVDCHGAGSCSLALHRKNGHEVGDGNAPPRFVTASLTVNYLKPTPQDVPLKAIGRVSEIHPKRWRAEFDVFANDIRVVTGEFVGVVMPNTFTKPS